MTAPRPTRDVRIVLTATGLLSFIPASRAAALALPELAFAAFFIGGVLRDTSGAAGPWFVLLATLLGLAIRRLDLESWTLFIPGGLSGRVNQGFGPRIAAGATGVIVIERMLLTALACVVFGHYLALFLYALTGEVRLVRRATVADLSTFAAFGMLAWLWLRARRGRLLTAAERARHVWTAIAVLVLLAGWGLVTAALQHAWPPVAFRPTPGAGVPTAVSTPVWMVIAALAALGRSAPAIGIADSISRAAYELEPPRLAGLRRAVTMTSAIGVLLTAGLSLLCAGLIPTAVQAQWMSAPLAGLTQSLHPLWARTPLSIGVLASAALLLAQTGRAGFWGAETALVRLSEDGVLPAWLRQQHPRFGTNWASVDTIGLVTAGAVMATGGRVGWLASAYAAAVLWTLVTQTATLARLRQRAQKAAAGVWMLTGLVGLSGAALLVHADGGAIAGTAMLLSAAVLFGLRATPVERPLEGAAADLLPSSGLSIEQLTPTPGSILVPVRNPHLLEHLVAALRSPREHEVVAMTVRLIDGDTGEDTTADARPTPSERELFGRVVALAEQHARPVRLVIVPAHDVFDAVVATIIRLHTSDVYVGESTSLSADDQARHLGEAWERASTPDLNVRLAVYRRSGRSDVYHLGPHSPQLGARDLELIHRMWLDSLTDVGTHIHHHDIVRAALIKMAEQLNGPNRDDALKTIRTAARPADELESVLRSRDYSRLRDMTRNRRPSELAEVLTDLSLGDQAVVFRLLPRKDAAAIFEYLEPDAREALLKTLSKEDVAALLNDMAPDDRTMFLEELPAPATRELLALLTPDERAVAVTLLGYPERSIGRLMTPDYIAVREDWTIQQVLDYVRGHGQDSETLNVIYVVDQQGLLIDDIRIREILLTDPAKHVSDLMDRRFVALKATDDQEAAVALFRQHDRSALPVTDTSGYLIGIVTVDDVLDVAETAATRDIQRIGGSEALDEPYMQIAMTRMVRKRAGWLTALFLGEMLTATAMGFFQDELAKALVLAMFIPLIISSGGNSGSQGSTLIIRALALGEVTLADWWRVMRREIVAGFMLGTILACVGFLRISVWSAFSDIYGAHWLVVAFTVAFALIGVVMWGTLIGALLPLLLRRLGFDPATSSAPFVATLVDVTGLIIYFSVALVTMHGTLLQ